jgi:cobalt-zinc-cadmium efflux system membrane fusion protein
MTLRPTPSRAFAGLALAALAGLTLCACSAKADKAAAPAAPVAANVTLTAAQQQHVRLYTVTPLTYHKTIEATGVVDFDNDQATSVLSPVSGPVSRLLVSPGQLVRSGDPLATVVSPDFAAAIETYRKALSAARNARRLADVDKDLLAHNGISLREAQQAETDAVGAEADRDAALQTLVSLQVDAAAIRAIQEGRPPARAEAVIRSPISGTVVEKLITPGQLLQAGATPSFTVANLSRVWVMAQVSVSDIGAVALGDNCHIQTGAIGAYFAGTVDNISALVNPDTRSVLVRVLVDNPGGLLKKQMYVRVQIQARQQNTGLLVPVSAVLRDDENLPFVYVTAGDGYARRHVTLGYRTGDQYDITEGLAAGDRIVVDGGIFLQFVQSQ